MSIYIKSILLIIFICVSGCTTYNDARMQLEKNLPESEKSYLIGKYSIQCQPNSKNTQCPQTFNSISVYYKNFGIKPFTDRLDSTNGSMFGDDTKYDKITYEKNEKSIYFCRVLPAGKYTIFTISYWNFAGGGSGYNLGEKDQFDIPFQLEAGKISTIDHLKLTTDKGKNLFGMSLNVPGGLEISGLSEEEIALAMQKCPESAKGKEVIHQNLWQKKYQSPFVNVKN